MKASILILTLFAISLNARSQFADSSYNFYKNKAESYYQSKDYKEAAISYSKAFSFFGYKAYPYDRYMAGCCWALAGIPDSAFYHLGLLVERIKYKEYGKISSDQNLKSLYPDKRWDSLMNIVKTNKYEFEKNWNRPLMRLLDSILACDSKYRFGWSDTLKTYGQHSIQMHKLTAIMRKTDSADQIIVCTILDKYGWLGKEIVGDTGNSAFFYVIQHSDSTIQVKYLPMLRDAVKNKNAEPWHLAWLEDRIALERGQKQIYGSQFMYNEKTKLFELYAVEDEANLNKRRAEIGLGTIEDTLKQLGPDYQMPGK